MRLASSLSLPFLAPSPSLFIRVLICRLSEDLTRTGVTPFVRARLKGFHLRWKRALFGETRQVASAMAIALLLSL